MLRCYTFRLNFSYRNFLIKNTGILQEFISPNKSGKKQEYLLTKKKSRNFAKKFDRKNAKKVEAGNKQEFTKTKKKTEKNTNLKHRKK